MQNFEEVLSHYGIRGKVIDIHDGPLLQQVVFQPAKGTKLSTVEAVREDIARELGLVSLRLGETAETGCIGFEFPQKQFKTIDFKQTLQAAGFTAGELPLCLGVDIAGNPVFADLAKMPHLLVGGTTGSGKSVGLNTFILSLMAAKRPQELKFVLIDPKRIEFGVYNRQKYMLCPVVSETEDAVRTIAYLAQEMDRRYALLEEKGYKNIKDYNEETDGKILPYIVCVIDEFADLMATDKNVEKDVRRLAQKARASGIHLILATQRPSVDVVTGVLKANFPSRLAYKTASAADSRTVLDVGGAENLVGRGDALFLSADGTLKRIHGAFIADKDIRAMLEPYRAEVKALNLPQLGENHKQVISKSSQKIGWWTRMWKFWTSLRQRDRKLIINGIFYVLGLFSGKISKTKKK